MDTTRTGTTRMVLAKTDSTRTGLIKINFIKKLEKSTTTLVLTWIDFMKKLEQSTTNMVLT